MIFLGKYHLYIKCFCLNLRPFKEYNMIIVNVKENESIDRALKRFKKKFERTGVLKELRGRTHFVKPSVKRRTVKLKAAYRQKMYAEENY